MADLEAKALDKETLDEIKSELEETKQIIKGLGPRRTSGPDAPSLDEEGPSGLWKWSMGPLLRQNH